MVLFLKRIKKSLFYENIITYIFYPLYNFLWTNIINFQARVLFIFLKEKKNFFNLDNNDKILIKNNINFENIAFEIKNEALPKLSYFKKKILSEEYKSKIMSKNKASGEIPYSIDIYNDLSSELKSKIVRFASSKKMVNTAANYMGIFPMITRIQVNLNIPRENSSARSAMLWHKDTFGFKNLDFFMAVTDVDEESGPFHCIEKKIKAGIFKNFKYDKNITGERGKVNFIDFDKIFKDFKILSLIGKSGTAFFLDSFSTFHRGGFCQSKDRLVLRICYQSHDVVHDSFQRMDNHFLYDETIKKQNMNNRYEKYLFFKKPSFLMRYLSKSLMKLFSLIEYKY